MSMKDGRKYGGMRRKMRLKDKSEGRKETVENVISNTKHKAEKHFYPLSSKRVKNCYSAIGLINNVLKKNKNLNLTTNRMKRKELLSKTLNATIKTIISREKQQKM